MSEPDAAVIARRSEIAERLREIVPGEGVIVDEHELKVYETDGLTAYRQVPMIVVLPDTTEQVSQVLRYCRENRIKVVPRGAGTSLSGGALPLADGIVLGLAKFNRILEIDYDNRAVVAQTGVTNLAITEAVRERGFYYAPDPSSQIVCTIGGNVAENAGGVHCLKYGLTANNILSVEMVLMGGEIIRLGGKHLDAGGYDLLGLMTGSEGLLGVITGVDHPRCGTLPDFGNFTIREGEEYDRYRGVEAMMAYAKGVSAKASLFDGQGNETTTDFKRMLKIVLDAGYRGYVGIEYSGGGGTLTVQGIEYQLGDLSEPDGIRATRDLLVRVRAELAGAYA